MITELKVQIENLRQNAGIYTLDLFFCSLVNFCEKSPVHVSTIFFFALFFLFGVLNYLHEHSPVFNYIDFVIYSR